LNFLQKVLDNAAALGHNTSIEKQPTRGIQMSNVYFDAHFYIMDEVAVFCEGVAKVVMEEGYYGYHEYPVIEDIIMEDFALFDECGNDLSELSDYYQGFFDSHLEDVVMESFKKQKKQIEIDSAEEIYSDKIYYQFYHQVV
jgi:hypothetical protein